MSCQLCVSTEVEEFPTIHHLFSQASRMVQFCGGSGWMDASGTLRRDPRLACLGVFSGAPACISAAGLATSSPLSQEELKGLFIAK